MRFLADAMLGKLAKWLRISGYDTLYESGVEDDELVTRAAGEGRVILTRDTRLARRLAPGGYLFIRDNRTADQFRQVVSELGLEACGPGFFTRCTVCNGELRAADRESVRGVVPEYTYSVTMKFLRCPSCGRVYWEGTHKARILERLKAAGTC